MLIEPIMTSVLRRLNRRYTRMERIGRVIGMPEGDPGRRLMLYLHIPFCVVLCPFCSFHRVRYREDRARRYFSTLRNEIRMAHDAGFRFSEIYVGGGTPTVDVAELVETIELACSLNPIRNVSIETNPDDLVAEKMRILRDVGVKRLSVGVQTLEDKLLDEMKRKDKYGNSDQIRERLAATQGLFDTLNVDLIFNLPHQSLDSLIRDIDILSGEIGVDQISFYPLMGADSTALRMKGEMGRVTYRRERKFYEAILDRLPDTYTASSAWCFSKKPGAIDEYIIEYDDYVGLGSGAMSYLNGRLYAASFSINRYIRLVEAGHCGFTRMSRFNETDSMRYDFLMKFFGIKVNKAKLEARWNGRFEKSLWKEFAAFRLAGAIRDDGEHWVLTRRGMYYWVLMMREFFISVSNFRDLMRLGIRSELDPEDLEDLADLVDLGQSGRTGELG
jgi:coproporphyrinogen III oxidase-like Fe-S oxidoreductase